MYVHTTKVLNIGLLIHIMIDPPFLHLHILHTINFLRVDVFISCIIYWIGCQNINVLMISDINIGHSDAKAGFTM